MVRRHVAVCFLVALVMTGGCSGAFGGDEENAETPTVTPADVPAVAGPDPSLPPGVTEAGVRRPSELVAAHEAVLANESHTVSSDLIERFGNGQLRRLKLAGGRYGSGERYYIMATFGGTALPDVPNRTAVWSNGERGLRATTRNGETSYLRGSGDGLLDSRTRYALATAEANNLQTLFASIDGATVEPIGNSSGVDRYRITATAFSEPSLSAIRPVETVENATFRAIVGSNGLIRSYRLTYTGTIDGRVVSGTEAIGYTDIGSTRVTEPSWSDAVTERDRNGTTSNATDSPSTAIL